MFCSGSAPSIQMAPLSKEAKEAVLLAAHSGSLQSFQEATKGRSAGDIAAVRDGESRSLLHLAAAARSLELCRHLVETCGVPVDAPDSDHNTALGLACSAKAIDVVEYLLEKGAAVEPLKDGTPGPLHRAAYIGSVQLMDLLVARGASLATATPDEGQPLSWAAGRGHTEEVRWLLARGASPQHVASRGVTPLFMAAAVGSVDVVEALADAGADPCAAAQGGITALHVAAAQCSPALVRLLLDRGATPCATQRDRAGAGDTPLEAAAKSRMGSGEARRGTLEVLVGVSPVPEGLTGPLTVEAADAWGREHGGGEPPTPSSAEKADDAPVASRRAVIPEPAEPDATKAAAAKRAGDEAFVAGRHGEAALQYNASLRHDTHNPAVWANRAMAMLRLGRHVEAIRDAMVSRTLDPTYTKAWFREGKGYHSLGRYQEAAEAFYMALQFDRDNEEVANTFLTAVEEGKRAHQHHQHHHHHDHDHGHQCQGHHDHDHHCHDHDHAGHVHH